MIEIKSVILDTQIITDAVLEVELTEAEILDTEIHISNDIIPVDILSNLPQINTEMEIGTVLCNGGGYPVYEGPYIAVPKVVEQTFGTYHTEMIADFKVKEITYLETANVGGGITATIGEL